MFRLDGNKLSLYCHPRPVPLLLAALELGCWDVHAILLPIYGSSIGLSATAIGSILATFSAAIVVAGSAFGMRTARRRAAPLVQRGGIVQR